MTKRDHVIALERPPKGEPLFDAGERFIVVDGVRWGRTIVSRHGCWGTKYRFGQFTEGQEGNRSEILEERPGTRYPGEINVRSEKRRGTWGREPGRPTEEIILEKVQELVASGRLRHPAVVKRLNDRRSARYWKQQEAEKVAAEKALRQKAAEALRVNDLEGEMIDRVVEAMKWAQAR